VSVSLSAVTRGLARFAAGFAKLAATAAEVNGSLIGQVLLLRRRK
jgi:hypothetical protein